eukprot:scaffold6259_cov75-Skeletonema_marinoi.AAC.13
MSEEDSDHNMTMCCASCGVAEVDVLKLKECTSCDLVRYCSDACQQEHSHQHEAMCIERAAELRDELLFKQPESSHLGDCPICFIPLPLDLDESIMQACCSKLICVGCVHAIDRREEEASLNSLCPFCRKATPETDKECNKYRMKRIEANDSVAMRREGIEQYEKGDYQSAFQYYTTAALLGEIDAHFRLGFMYHNGQQGVEKDGGKFLHHMEEATIGGHPYARYNLGCDEWNNGNNERAVRHWIIAANQGDNDSIETLMDLFKEGYVSKDDLATALRAHQAAVDATKSPQREAAKIAGT